MTQSCSFCIASVLPNLLRLLQCNSCIIYKELLAIPIRSDDVYKIFFSFDWIDVFLAAIATVIQP